jgi:hypothetical protein
MLQYAVKRTLWMIPTFFFISLVVFALINLAPGNPGQAGGLENIGTGAAVQSASVIMFKRQFNLDKPILLNTRFALSRDEVRALVATANGVAGDPTPRARIAAKDALEDDGQYLVRHLIPLLTEDPDPAIRQLAAQYLTTAAVLPLVSETAGDAAAARD